MDKPTRQRLYEPTGMLATSLCAVKSYFGLTDDDTMRALATMVATLDDDARGVFHSALEDVRKDMVAEKVFERAEVSLAVQEAAAVARKS